MIYVATVHFGTPKWIDVQHGYLKRHLKEPFTTYAVLEGISEEYRSRFDHIVEGEGTHEGKLNLLAAEISVHADPDDIILFLDGDAFPIADPMPTISAGLETTTLVAVRRDENRADKQPHPCFCAIRIKDWERLHGDWSSGYVWVDNFGKSVSDVGANLLACLERTSSPWTPLLRSNKRNDHPVWFGVYGNIVYHHGAGFRRPYSRVDQDMPPLGPKWGWNIPLVAREVVRINARRKQQWLEDLQLRWERVGDHWFELLQHNPDFYLQLVEP